MYLCLCYDYFLVSNCIDYAPSVSGDASCMFTSHTYILLRLASKFLNYTCCPREMVKKLNKYAVKHKINRININSYTFTSLPVAFLVENSTENTEKNCKVFQHFVDFFSVTMRGPSRLTHFRTGFFV